ncbi:MAG: glycosyltransferase [Spirochaetes bacterium]|nr:glycosyltransferase [Spirochaetota bacterium]
MKLAIISHTEHYLSNDGTLVGWGPTVREINHLAPHFEKVYHVACLHAGTPPPSSMKYTEPNIEFVQIPPFGGNNIRGKLSVLTTMPVIIKQVSRIIDQVDFFQLRLPTGFGNYLLPWLKIFRPKAKFWVKYAGNWAQENPPLGYAFQRWWLKNNFSECKVTVNGRWPHQPDHVISFENPCLTEQERNEGREILKLKDFSGYLDFAFIGQFTEQKGIGRVIEAFKLLKEPRIGFLHIVGDGVDRGRYEKLALEAGIRCKFYGFLPKDNVNKILIKSHVLLLPSESEGFPKVVAEAANFGCLPVVSAVSSLPQYIKDNENGFLMSSINANGIIYCIKDIISKTPSELKAMAINAYKMSDTFTYDLYVKRIKTEIIRML